MSTMNFNLRGIDTNIMSALKHTAKKQQISINVLILNYVEKGLGYVSTVNRPIYHDLDFLAGTWSESDAKEFKDNTVFFEKIDKDLWS